MTPTPTTTISVSDSNESKFLFALGFTGTPAPRNSNMLDFEFNATDELFEARRGYSLNHSIPVLSFISASRHVDKLIADHRQRQGVRP